MTFFSSYPNVLQEMVFSNTDVDGLEKIIKTGDKRQTELALQELFSRRDKLALQAQRRYLRKWIAKPGAAQLAEDRVIKGAVQTDDNILAGKAGLSFEDKYLRLEYLVMRQLQLSCNYGNLVEYAPRVLGGLSFLDLLPILSTRELSKCCSLGAIEIISRLALRKIDKISRLPYSVIGQSLSVLFKDEYFDFALFKTFIASLPEEKAEKFINDLYELLEGIARPKFTEFKEFAEQLIKLADAIDYLGDYFSPIQLKKLAEALLFADEWGYFRESLEKVIRFFPDWRQQIIEEALSKVEKNKEIDQKSLVVLYRCRHFLSNFDWVSVIIKNNMHNLERNVRDLNVFFQHLSDRDANSLMQLCLDEFRKPNASKRCLTMAMDALAPYITNLRLIDECLDGIFLDNGSYLFPPPWNFYKRAVDFENVGQRIEQVLDILKDSDSYDSRCFATGLLEALSSKMTVRQLQKFKDLLLCELRKTRPDDHILYLLHYIPLRFESHEKVELSRIFNQSTFTEIDTFSSFIMRVAPILSSDDIAHFFEKLYQFGDVDSSHFDSSLGILVGKMNPSKLVIKVRELLTQAKNAIAINECFLEHAIDNLSIDLCTDELISDIFTYYEASENLYRLAKKFSGRIPVATAYAILDKHQYDYASYGFKAMDILLKGLNAGLYEQLINSFIEKYPNPSTNTRDICYQHHFIFKLLPHLSAAQATSILAFAPTEVLFEAYNPCIAERLLTRTSTEEKDKILKSYIERINNSSEYDTSSEYNSRKVMLEIITNHLMQVTNKDLVNKEKETLKETLVGIVGKDSVTDEFIKLKAFASLCLTFLLKRKLLAKEETPLLLIDCLNNTEFRSLCRYSGKLFCTLECDSSMNADILSRFIEKQLGIPIEDPYLNNRGKWELRLAPESERYIGFTPDLLKKSIYQSINDQLNSKTRITYEAIFNKETNLAGKEKLLYYFKAFLIDYTKGDAWYSGAVRLFHGHANRHHTKAISRIISRIGTSINDPLELLETLEKKVHHTHLGGSLTRRKAFMWDKYNDYLKQLNPVINDSQKEYSRQSYVCC